MKTSLLNKQLFINNEALIYRSCLTLCLIIFLVMAGFNFISHSEFWAITSAKLLGSTSSLASVVYYKSFFYSLLKPIYWLPLDNVNHIRLARLLFGFIAWLNFWLILTNIKWITESKRIMYLYGFFLLSFQIYFYNNFRIRADILTHFFSLCLYTYINYQFLNDKKFKIFDTTITILVLCIFLTSPKSIYPLMCLLIYRAVLSRKNTNSLTNLKSTYTTLLAPLGFLLTLFSLLFYSGFFNENPYALALKYHLTSSQNYFLYNQWIHLLISIKLNTPHYLVLFIGLFYYIKNKNHTKPILQAQVVLSALTWFCLIFHSEKLPYFISSLTPWLFLPVVFLFLNFKKSSRTTIVFLICLLIYPLFIGHKSNWFHSNKKQLQIIQKLEEIVREVPNSSYFDSTGLLPREKAHMWFLGPNDPNAKKFTILSFKEVKPDFIFLTPKVRLAFPEIIITLTDNYKLINNSIYLYNGTRHRIHHNALKEDFQLEHIFNYDYLPITLF